MTFGGEKGRCFLCLLGGREVAHLGDPPHKMFNAEQLVQSVVHHGQGGPLLDAETSAAVPSTATPITASYAAAAAQIQPTC